MNALLRDNDLSHPFKTLGDDTKPDLKQNEAINQRTLKYLHLCFIKLVLQDRKQKKQLSLCHGTSSLPLKFSL